MGDIMDMAMERGLLMLNLVMDMAMVTEAMGMDMVAMDTMAMAMERDLLMLNLATDMVMDMAMEDMVMDMAAMDTMGMDMAMDTMDKSEEDRLKFHRKYHTKSLETLFMNFIFKEFSHELYLFKNK